MITDNVAVNTDISVGLNRMNCTGVESMLTECESAYKNSTAGCNKRDMHMVDNPIYSESWLNTVSKMSSHEAADTSFSAPEYISIADPVYAVVDRNSKNLERMERKRMFSPPRYSETK